MENNMTTLKKSSGKDFIILNITDIQLLNEDWENNTSNVAVFNYTMSSLLERITPDLITITGDIANRGDTDSYKRIFSYFDSLSIPWAPIWGNGVPQPKAFFLLLPMAPPHLHLDSNAVPGDTLTGHPV